MKILFATENSYSGGLDSFLVNLINHWPHSGDQLVLLCNRSHPGLAEVAKRVCRDLLVVPHDVPLLWEMLHKLDQWRWPRLIRKILSAGLRYPYLVFYIARMAFELRKIGADRMMIVNGGFPGGDTCRAVAFAWRLFGLGPEPVMNVHNLAVRALWWQRVPEFFLDLALRRTCRCILTVSNACAASFANRPVFRGPAFPIHVIYNGIEGARVPKAASKKFRRDLGIPETVFLFVMLATYEPRKGHDYLLRAMATLVVSCPDARLVICGYGQPAEVAHVQALVARYGLAENVYLRGFRNDVTDIIAASNALVVPSQAFESFGLTAVEAMALGKPVIATTVGGLPEVLDYGNAGLLVDPTDPAKLAAAMVRLIRDPKFSANLAKSGHDNAVKRFLVAPMAAAYAAHLHGVADPSLDDETGQRSDSA